MSVKPDDLDHPERGLDLSTRATPEEKAPARKRDDGVAAELRSLRERIESAKAATPKDAVPHCGDCFHRGWLAAVRAIEGEG